MARRARIMARRRRHIPPITDDNFHEEWNKFKMDLDASEDDIVYTSFAREQKQPAILVQDLAIARDKRTAVRFRW